jgi:RNA polymerase sigma-70 factor, ECF subfamily
MNDEQTRARFESLLLPLLTDAYNLARWLMKNQEDAEDMVQESYLKAFRFFGSFNQGGNCRAWFLRIVRNTCYTALEARKLREKEVPIEEDAYDGVEDPSLLPAAILDKTTTIEVVRKAIEQLPADFREALVLREFEGLSYKEIADVSGVPLGTVMSRLARARNQLQFILLEQKKQETL